VPCPAGSQQRLPKVGRPSPAQLGSACTPNPDVSPSPAMFTLIQGQGEPSRCHHSFVMRAPRNSTQTFLISGSFDLWIHILLLTPAPVEDPPPAPKAASAPYHAPRPSIDTRTAQRDPKTSAHPKATLNPEERTGSGLESNLPPEEVTAVSRGVEPSCPMANQRCGRSCAGDERRQRGGLWAGWPSDHKGQAARRLRSGLPKAGQ